jgi:hypothetical protein
MKGRINIGAGVSHDFSYGKWPFCKAPKSHGGGYEAQDPDMIFDVEWRGSYWDCRCDGYGRTAKGLGDYGNGSIFVREKEGVTLIKDATP